MLNLIESILIPGQQIIARHPYLMTLLCAEFFFAVVKSPDLITVFKKRSQRTIEEAVEIQLGLARSLLLECVLFVPISVALFLLIIFPLIRDGLLQISSDIQFWYAVGGIMSYGFPFATIRAVILRIATNTLREFVRSRK